MPAEAGMKRTVVLAIVSVIVAVAAAAAAWRVVHPPAPGPLPVLPCRVVVDDPANGLARVRLEFEQEALRYRRNLSFAFIDVRGTAQMLRLFNAELDGRSIDVRPTRLGDFLVFFVGLGLRPRNLVVSYTIEPTFFPPGSPRSDPADSRSRIAPGLAIIRSTSLFPRLDVPGAKFGVEFELPPGWVAATPWQSEEGRLVVPSDTKSPVEYFALGPFETRELSVGSEVIRVATPALAAVGPVPLESIVAREMELLDAPLKRKGPFLATVVPDDFMHGGAAGEHSIVQSPMPFVLAHEVFHWWNDGALTAPDASWFKEGLTQYYGIRVAREAGASTPEAETACYADLEAEMRLIEADAPRSLVDASKDPRASRLVYSKGALFWMLADRRLRASGRFLEEGVRRVVTSPRRGLTTAELKSVFSAIYQGALDPEFDRYVLGANRLPDLGLPPATGRTGCAMIVPR